eukprot:6487091-Amphidinium_carterae.2
MLAPESGWCAVVSVGLCLCWLGFPQRAAEDYAALSAHVRVCSTAMWAQGLRAKKAGKNDWQLLQQ